MEAWQWQLIALLRGGLVDEPVTLHSAPDIEALTDASVRQGIVVPVFCGLLGTGFAVGSPEMTPLLQAYGNALYTVEEQQRELAVLFADFAAAGVDYMPLKGAALRALYARPELRSMGDADVLIRVPQYADAAAVLLRHGFSCVQESAHEWIFEKDTLRVELHKCLFPPYERALYAYFSDGFAHAVSAGAHRFSLTDTAEFVYLFAHFAKHYQNGGVGLRQLADLWVYRRKKAVDERAAKEAFTELGLAVFYRHIETVLAVCFDGAPLAKDDRHTPFILDFLLSGGSFGTPEETRAAAAARTGGGTTAVIRAREMRRLLFPRLGDMQCKYPVLRKAPFLLPLFWAVRGVCALFAPRRITARLRGVQTLCAADAERHKAALAFVGFADDGGAEHG